MNAIRIPIYQGYRHLGLENRDVYPWTFTPLEDHDLPVPGLPGLISDQVRTGGDDPAAAILAPAGSRVAETASGGLALYLPGSSIGIAAPAALAMARRGEEGLAIAD